MKEFEVNFADGYGPDKESSYIKLSISTNGVNLNASGFQKEWGEKEYSPRKIVHSTGVEKYKPFGIFEFQIELDKGDIILKRFKKNGSDTYIDNLILAKDANGALFANYLDRLNKFVADANQYLYSIKDDIASELSKENDYERKALHGASEKHDDPFDNPEFKKMFVEKVVKFLDIATEYTKSRTKPMSF